MRMSASQLKDDTKFCIYNEVQLPDATGKMHILKPFLVIGNGQSTFKPLLTLLKGAKRFLCEGTCSMENGKVTLYGNKVPFGQFKRQAALMKEVLGKQIGAPSGVKEEDDEEEEETAGKPTPALHRSPMENIAATAAKPPVAAPPPRPAGPPPPPKPPLQAAKPAPPPPPAPPGKEPHPVRLAKASTAWHGTRGIVDGKCKELKQAIRAHYGKSHPEVLKEIEKNMHKIDAIVGKLDHKLAVSLQKASGAPNEGARAAELRNARAILNEYIRYVKAEPLIAHIDKNPFGVQCNLRQVLASSLTQMSQTIVA
ncbi:MAG TPA: hypothetical protein VHW09_16465 [Bryobacteraceae bacterium]|nr:hypothetical protein [Bryobacteraceae bacterium]